MAWRRSSVRSRQGPPIRNHGPEVKSGFFFNKLNIDFNKIKVYAYTIAMEQKWLEVLTDDDLEFLHQFILCSGSLKDLASQYGVSYPTIRIRADKIIEKIRMVDNKESPFVAYIKTMAMDEKISLDAARDLITMFRLIYKE